MDIDKLFVNLTTQEKRAVNKLIRTLAGGKVKQTDFAAICRSINRNTLKGSRIKKPPSAYILFHSDRFPVFKAAHPDAKLGDLAKMVGADWNALPPAQKAAYESRAADAKTRASTLKRS
jgi:hypothetical protein